ncbi:hypothetical protein HN748_05335 [Candidatus Peregrinibacteria bacterium]|jgi:hypothetical protein|nr:hypothetical protein [Candidatus Peregrinibacteria bacterium]MBT7703631.1 hypothetical protein [Candidatus Peregrinibacteria bacterium]
MREEQLHENLTIEDKLDELRNVREQIERKEAMLTKNLYEVLPHLGCSEVIRLFEQLHHISPFALQPLERFVERELRQRLKGAFYGNRPEREIPHDPVTHIRIETPLATNRETTARLVIYGREDLESLLRDPPQGGRLATEHTQIIFGDKTAYISLTELRPFIEWIEDRTYQSEMIPGLEGIGDAADETDEDRASREREAADLEAEREAALEVRQQEVDATLRAQTARIRGHQEALGELGEDANVARLMRGQETEIDFDSSGAITASVSYVPRSSVAHSTMTARRSSEKPFADDVVGGARRAFQGIRSRLGGEEADRDVLGPTVRRLIGQQLDTGEHPVAKDGRGQEALSSLPPEEPEVEVPAIQSPVVDLRPPPLTEEEQRIKRLLHESNLLLRGVKVWSEGMKEIIESLDSSIAETNVKQAWSLMKGLGSADLKGLAPRWIQQLLQGLIKQRRLDIHVDSVEWGQKRGDLRFIFVGNPDEINNLLQPLQVLDKEAERVTEFELSINKILEFWKTGKPVIEPSLRMARVKEGLAGDQRP